jgi:hypothetical protein
MTCLRELQRTAELKKTAELTVVSYLRQFPVGPERELFRSA